MMLGFGNSLVLPAMFFIVALLVIMHINGFRRHRPEGHYQRIDISYHRGVFFRKVVPRGEAAELPVEVFNHVINRFPRTDLPRLEFDGDIIRGAKAKKLYALALSLILLGVGAYHLDRHLIAANTDLSCPAGLSACIPQLEEKLGVDTDQLIQEAEQQHLELKEEARKSFEALACTMPGKAVFLSAAGPKWVDPEHLWRSYLRVVSGSYVLLPDGASAESFTKHVNKKLERTSRDFVVQWEAPDGGYFTVENSDSWEELLDNKMRSWSDRRDLALASSNPATITCPNPS